jgi:hypothetical protein
MLLKGVAAPYPLHSRFVIVDADKSDSLNRQVWTHAARAQARGLEPVVEVWARSSVVSRSLNRWWREASALMCDTLDGIYLVRVDLVTFGPEAVLKLTPFALAGVPLFLGWNPIGQVLTAREFAGPDPEELALSLSAFVEDVLAQRPHTLNPRPSLGSAKWDAKLTQLRRERGRFRPESPPPALPTLAPPTLAPPTPAPPTPALAAPSHVVVSAPAPTAKPDAAPESATFDLDRYLLGARNALSEFAQREQLDLDFSLESLQALDRYLDNKADVLAKRAAELIPVFGVYLGDTVCHHQAASWYLAPDQPSPIEAVRLRFHGTPSRPSAAPVALVLELASDRSRSLFGHAVQLCSAP